MPRTVLTESDTAELFATVVAGIIGGICLSILEVQPVSATGAILQETLSFTDGSKSLLFIHSKHIDETALKHITGHDLSNAVQGLVVFRLFAMIFPIVFGVQLGRKMCHHDLAIHAIPYLVSIFLTFVTIITITLLYLGDTAYNVSIRTAMAIC